MATSVNNTAVESKIEYLETFTFEQFIEKEEVKPGTFGVNPHKEVFDASGNKVANTKGYLYFTYKGADNIVKYGDVTRQRTINDKEVVITMQNFFDVLTKPMISLVKKLRPDGTWSEPRYMIHQEKSTTIGLLFN